MRWKILAPITPPTEYNFSLLKTVVFTLGQPITIHLTGIQLGDGLQEWLKNTKRFILIIYGL